jgi:hypothetical protein
MVMVGLKAHSETKLCCFKIYFAVAMFSYNPLILCIIRTCVFRQCYHTYVYHYW